MKAALAQINTTVGDLEGNSKRIREAAAQAKALGADLVVTGSYLAGFAIFAGLCFVAIVGLGLVKTRWRTTWGAVSGARV